MATRGDTDNVILSAAHAAWDRDQDAFQAATQRDFVALCTDDDGDQWALFPVADVDERGEVMAVHWRRGNIEQTYRIRKRRTQMVVRDLILRDRQAVHQLCWTEHKGLRALREAIRPHTICAKAEGLSPSPSLTNREEE